MLIGSVFLKKFYYLNFSLFFSKIFQLLFEANFIGEQNLLKVNSNRKTDPFTYDMGLVKKKKYSSRITLICDFHRNSCIGTANIYNSSDRKV